MQPRRILTRSFSVMSEAGNKALGLVAKRKGSQNATEDIPLDDETDPAYLATEPNSPFVFPTEAGCRQGGYFDAVALDFDIPQVATGEDEEADELEGSRDSVWSTSDFQDIAYELGVADILLAPSDPNANPYYPPDALPREPTSFSSSVDGGAGVGERKSPLRNLVRRISNTLIMKSAAGVVVVEKSDSPDSSPASTIMSLPQFDELPPQLARFSFASDATTGTLARYLARRQVQARGIEKTLNMSILAYEREGSWLIDHDSMDRNFVCPFPTCEAHYGAGLGRKTRRRHRQPVETVYED